MDIAETTTPKSDQQNFDDYLAGERTVTIQAVTPGTQEQPVNIELLEYPGRPYKPNKSMRRVLVVAWGRDSTEYVGRRLTLVGNPDVKWGGKAVGGIEIAAMSNLTGPITVPLTATRGQRRNFTVHPLPDRDWKRDLKLAGTNIEAVVTLGKAAKLAGVDTTEITARYNELKKLI